MPQGARALRPANLVRGQAEIIDAQHGHIDRDLAEPLNCITHGQPFGLAHQGRCLSHWLDHACLIIRQHQAQDRNALGVMVPIRQARGEILKINNAFRRDIGCFDTCA